ncbi:MAG: hypothetical protein LUE11_12245 [Clostridia bacterium]|nr:hypothetical protein [Clostridia bacterium]
MDYFDTLIEKRIDSRTADVVDRLLEQYLPNTEPCAVPLDTVLEQLQTKYAFTLLPKNDINYARTALAVIEAYFPEDASYLHHDWDRRLEGAADLVSTLRLSLFCAEVQDTDAGHALYERQKAQYEQRTAGSGQIWHRMPIRVCAEAHTGYCLVTGSDRLKDEITCLRGVTQEDIEHCTPTLIAYLRAKYE